MLKKRAFAIVLAGLIFNFCISTMALGSSTIKLTIKSETSMDDWGGRMFCVHYYTISSGGVEVIPKTPLPHNKTTVIELPSIKGDYTVDFIKEGIYAGGQPTGPKPVGVNRVFRGNKSSEITLECFLRGGGHGIVSKGGGFPGTDILSSSAGKTAGETSVPVAVAIVVALAGVAASAAGAAASAAAGSGATGEEGGNGESGGSYYKMCIYKEFGDKIKYNGETVFVYARMVEINDQGEEIDRPDLTQRIEIFSTDPFFDIGSAAMSGAYMGASVDAVSARPGGMPGEGTISFRFTGEGGVFQNNVKFKMVGECYIALKGQKLYVLASSGNRFEMPYDLVDFLNEAEVTVNVMHKTHPFDLDLDRDKDGRTLIIATDRGEKKPFESFYDSFSCEIEARNEKEYARTVFYVVMCYEGLLPDFLGKGKEIIGYKNEKGEMAETLIAFRLGIWNGTAKTLDFVKPDGIEVDCHDERGVFEVIGLDYDLDEDSVRNDAVLYRFRAQKPLPAMDPAKGTLRSSCILGERSFENETRISLIPDVMQYEADFAKEYQNCLRIINTYLPESFREKKLRQLEQSLPRLGISDLKIFRENCWKIAERCIMQEKESYLIDSYWYDEAIATAELLVYVGDIAFDVALAPFGGPIAGFLAAQVKGAFIDFVAMYVEKPSVGFGEVMEFLDNRYVQMVGQADGAFEMPKPEETKKLAAWLACYTIYRIVYHWWYDKDDDDNPVGLTESVKRGLLDFAGKGASTILAGFAGDIAKKKGWDKYSVTDADQALVNEKVAQGAKTVLDFGDKAAARLDQTVAQAVKTLADFIDKIRSGSVAF